MNEFIEQLYKDLMEKAKESMDGHYAMIEPIIVDWRHIESALKESYTKGVEDAIKICNSEMNKWERNDYSIGRYESSVEIRFQLQKLIEQELGQLKEK